VASRTSGTSRAAAAALALLVGAARAEVPVDTLALEMAPRDADVLFRKDPFDKSSFPVVVLGDDGARLPGRVEVKGSFTRQTGKKSVLIKLDDGKWRGQSRISLNGMGTDGTMMREWLNWELMHALRMVAPATRYTRLAINGANQGVFLRIDWIDTKMFERFGLGADGEQFHPYDSTYCGDLTPVSLEPRRNCWLKLAPRGSKDFSSLAALVHEIGTEPVDTFDRLVERRFDVDSVVNWFAVNALVSLTDTYNKNYFLYRSAKTGRWTVVPWDYDLTLGRSYDPFRDFPFTILNEHFQYYYPIEAGQSNPLHYQALKNPALRARVVARLRELTQGDPDAAHPWRGWFAPARMARRIGELRARLQPELARDPFLAGQQRRFGEEVDSLLFYTRARVRFLERTLLGEPDWLAQNRAAAEVAPQQEADLVDGWGFVLAQARPRAGRGTVRVTALPGWPWLVPGDADRAACVQRTWLVAADAPGIVADLTVTYLDENLVLREPGARVADERTLHLFAEEDGRWRALPTVAAPLANTLTTPGLALPAGAPLRLVACVGVRREPA
jgi:hypothetical protein